MCTKQSTRPPVFSDVMSKFLARSTGQLQIVATKPGQGVRIQRGSGRVRVRVQVRKKG